MGNCMKSGITKSTSMMQELYPRLVELKIKNFNERGKVSSLSKVNLFLTSPMIVSSNEMSLNNTTVWVSLCVLPGIDPRGEIHKECQDLCFLEKKEKSLLLTLYDGHGAHGHKVVEFCKNACTKYFHEASFEQDIQAKLVHITHKVDEDLKVCRNIDSKCSGSTQAMALFDEKYVYCAAVGDSRIVMANIYRKPIQMTEDQKPEHPEEMERIVNAGGRVDKLSDESGNKVGPYRVWEQHLNSPGLAMSRSIGDTAGSHLGIICTPVISRYKLKDALFVVAASDGVWDVFSNQEAVNFIDQHRNICVKDIHNMNQNRSVNLNNACIAQLLCEEARKRWFKIVENEDVIIDDISCVIIELDYSKYFQ